MKKNNNKNIVHIKDEIKPVHFEQLKKIIKSKTQEIPVLIIENLKNGKNHQVIRDIHNYLMENGIDIGCIIFGKNEFSAIVLLSSEYIKFRSATYDAMFVQNIADYIEKNSTKKTKANLAIEIFNIMNTENPFNGRFILSAYHEKEEFCVHDAYKLGLVDNIMIIDNDSLTDENELHETVEMLKPGILLYIDRMISIKEYLIEIIAKLY